MDPQTGRITPPRHSGAHCRNCIRTCIWTCGNSPPAALKRKLKTHGAAQKITDAIDELDCRSCRETRRPATARNLGTIYIYIYTNTVFVFLGLGLFTLQKFAKS